METTMRTRTVLGLLLAVGAMGCASFGIGTAPTEAVAPPDTSAVLRMVGRFGAAHACPIAADVVVTAAHVADLRPFDAAVPLWPYRFEGGGTEGVMEPTGALLAADLAAMKPARPLARWYTRATQPPQPGDRLWLLAYDWRDVGSMYADRVVSGRVVRVVAGNLVLDEEVPRGASGSCVLNAAGEVVGVVTWGQMTEDGHEVGVVAAVFGEWWEQAWAGR